MKICIIITTYLPKVIGGTQIATFYTAKTLAKRGHEVHIITRRFKKELSFEKKGNVFLHRLHFNKKYSYTLGTIIYFIKLLILIKKINPEIIHAQKIKLNGCYAVLIKKILKIPCIISIRGSDIYLSSNIYKQSIVKFVIKSSDLILSLCEDMKNIIQQIHSKTVIVIPNGIDSSLYKNLEKYPLRKSLGFSDNEKIILYVGRLDKIKGVIYLIKTMRILVGKIPDIKLIIIGDGPERKELENITNVLNLQKKITFMGFLQHNLIPKYMIASDIFILPSLSESFGIVNIEAMSGGLPIVATNVGGIPEIIINEINGFLVEPKNETKLAEKVILLLINDKLREEISNYNRKIGNKYSWEIVVDKLEQVYKSTIEENNNE